MHVLTFAPRRGHRRDDPVPELQEALADLGLRRPPERTAQLSAIALADRAESAFAALRTAAESGTWCIGLGIGAVDQPAPAETRAMTGPAVDAADEALRQARTTSQVPLAVRAADHRQAGTADDAEAVLRLIGWMIATRNTGQWRIVRAVRDHPGMTQRELAEHLGITQQSVSRGLQTSGWREESAAVPLLVRLLSMIDLTSRG